MAARQFVNFQNVSAGGEALAGVQSITVAEDGDDIENDLAQLHPGLSQQVANSDPLKGMHPGLKGHALPNSQKDPSDFLRELRDLSVKLNAMLSVVEQQQGGKLKRKASGKDAGVEEGGWWPFPSGRRPTDSASALSA